MTRHDEDGATAVEYALLLAVVAVVIVAAVGLFGAAVNGLFDDPALPEALSP